MKFASGIIFGTSSAQQSTARCTFDTYSKRKLKGLSGYRTHIYDMVGSDTAELYRWTLGGLSPEISIDVQLILYTATQYQSVQKKDMGAHRRNVTSASTFNGWNDAVSISVLPRARNHITLVGRMSVFWELATWH